MPAELGLDRRLRVLAFRQFDERIRELLDVGAGGRPIEIAAVGRRAGVLRLLGQVFELGAGLQFGDDRLRVGFLLDENVARLVFLAAGFLDEQVVLLAHFGVGGRIGLEVVLRERADEHLLARTIDLRLHFGIACDAFFLGFLHQDFACDEVFANRFLQFGRVLLTLLDHLRDDRIDLGLGDSLAVDDSDVLCRSDGGNDKRKKRGDNGQKRGCGKRRA